MITATKDFAENITGAPCTPVLCIEGKKLVVTSGTCCDDLDEQIPSDFKSQAEMTLKACQKFLESAGCTFDDVFNVEVYLKDINNWTEFNAIYMEKFNRKVMPCRKAIQAVLLPGYELEVVMWAVSDK